MYRMCFGSSEKKKKLVLKFGDYSKLFPVRKVIKIIGHEI